MPQYKKKLKRGERWYYRFSFQGIIYRSNAVYLSRLEAKKAETQKFREVETGLGQVKTDKDIFLLDLINERLDYLKVAKSEKYFIENRHYLKILYEYVGNIKIQIISRGDIQKLLLEQSKKQKLQNNDNYSINAMLRAFKSLFFYGIKYLGVTMVNPCVGIDLFSVKKKMKYIPTDEEIENLLNQCQPDLKLLIEFVRDTGCRISEALKLTWDNVFDGYVILHTRKSKSSNQIPREAKFDTTKFSCLDQNQVTIFSKWKEPPRFISERTNKKWNWHNLRHRFASKLSKNGTPLFEIMNLLGHNNLQTTQNYLHLINNS
jgi:integrase